MVVTMAVMVIATVTRDKSGYKTSFAIRSMQSAGI